MFTDCNESLNPSATAVVSNSPSELMKPTDEALSIAPRLMPAGANHGNAT